MYVCLETGKHIQSVCQERSLGQDLSIKADVAGDLLSCRLVYMFKCSASEMAAEP